MIVNSVIGVVILAPLPGWSQLAGFISSAAVLSLAIGPVALMALRRQAADYERPFRVPFARVTAPIAFTFVGFIVYWSGWDSNWKLMLIGLAGGLYFLAHKRAFDRSEPLFLKHGSWMLVYYPALAAISWLGNFGGGLGVIPMGVDAVILVVMSLAVFYLAERQLFPIAKARQLIAETKARRLAG